MVWKIPNLDIKKAKKSCHSLTAISVGTRRRLEFLVSGLVESLARELMRDG